MDLDLIIIFTGKILLLVFLVSLNGFFVAAEFALVKLRQTQLNGLISEGHRRAKVARLLMSNLDASLIDYVVDRNVHKHGKYMPGVHIPIRAPEKLLADLAGPKRQQQNRF